MNWLKNLEEMIKTCLIVKVETYKGERLYTFKVWLHLTLSSSKCWGNISSCNVAISMKEWYLFYLASFKTCVLLPQQSQNTVTHNTTWEYEDQSHLFSLSPQTLILLRTVWIELYFFHFFISFSRIFFLRETAISW